MCPKKTTWSDLLRGEAPSSTGSHGSSPSSSATDARTASSVGQPAPSGAWYTRAKLGSVAARAAVDDATAITHATTVATRTIG